MGVVQGGGGYSDDPSDHHNDEYVGRHNDAVMGSSFSLTLEEKYAQLLLADKTIQSTATEM
jgi:hypothetical protein